MLRVVSLVIGVALRQTTARDVGFDEATNQREHELIFNSSRSGLFVIKKIKILEVDRIQTEMSLRFPQQIYVSSAPPVKRSSTTFVRLAITRSLRNGLKSNSTGSVRS